MVEFRVLLGKGIALPLLRQDMDNDRSSQLFGPSQNGLKRMHVMTVHRPQILEAHGVEHVLRQQLFLDRLFSGVCGLINKREFPEGAAVPAFEAQITRLDTHFLQHTGETADIRVYRHVVVVEDDDERLPARGSGGKALITKPACHGAVADQRGNVVILMQQRPGLRHTERNRN